MAVTGIALECKHPDGTSAGFVGSRYGPSFHPKGKWQKLRVCREEKPAFLTRFSLKVQKQLSGDVDNTAVNNVKFQCAGNERMPGRPIQGKGLSWYLGEYAGDFGKWSPRCPAGSAICGLATKVEQPVGVKADSTGLNDAKFYCCPDK